MAYKNHSCAFFALAFILLATTNPLVQGLPVVPSILNGVNIAGQLCCTPTGTCPGNPLPGVVVRVNCTNLLGVSIFTGQTTTNVNGNFNISIPNVVGLLETVLGGRCRVTVNLPLSQAVCPVLATTTGVLTVLEGVVGTITTVITGILTFLLNIAISGFIVVSA